MFAGSLSMHETCDVCHYKFERAPGYFLGSIYVNYGLTSILVVIGYFSLFLTGILPHSAMLWTLGAICVLVPLIFFRYARALWCGFDQYWDPVPEDDETNDHGNATSMSSKTTA
ncbi:MAG: DUF983 domain-containing protein [Planctomycetales bacterium]|nr:DUF983 domain-containing protein [Planctomycetales bacterium]